MDHVKNGSENINRDFKIKDAVFVFSSFTFVCSAVIFALVIYDVLTIGNIFSVNNPIESIMIAVISSVALLAFGVLLTFIIPSKHIDDTNKTYQDHSLSAIIIFMFIIVLFEELLFRGIIQNLLFVFTDHQWIAILSTTLLFLAAHVQYFKKPIMFLNIFIPGLVFGWIYFKTNNLLVPVFVHFILNVGMTILFKYKIINLKQ
ncbi:CAAX protease family protein [Sporosarcina sp. P37]|uniref:CPBP family intramembrane glutamic endopeptidase n=1 Tax=unclassified Sporosarcina TaxID=2647733 RepID=UPI000A17B34D|nr:MULTISPECIES: CPBP family intramembrane glutamic endopeptidase [unclassified Sporosarcina]ARK25158.1 CAAX protease family protein [Sporosarcina sp. P37]PID16256.1 CPBP family intramembrane metalloprotease [Sporosarcina sp. P35]